MSDGLDDELIALVGEDASSPPARAHSPSTGKSHRRSALLSDLSSDEDASGDDDKEERNPYPLEGIYKDEDDREWLLSMNELEREDVLSQRRDEISRRQQQAQLAAMVRSQQAAAGKTRRTSQKKTKMTADQRAKRRSADARRELEDLADPFAEDTDEEDVFRESDDDDDDDAAPSQARRRPTSTKADKLSELRRKRQERAHGVSSRADVSDDDEPPPRRRRRRALDSDDDYASESDYEPSYTLRRSRGEPAIMTATSDEPPSLALLNSVRLGRDELERLLFLPNGKDLVRGCFVRCSWGMREKREGGKEHVYRVHQITDVQQREKYYDVSTDHAGRWMNSYVSFRWGGKDHSVDLRPLSTQVISDSERQRWIAAAGPDAKFPSTEAIQAKHQQLEAALTTPLTEDDVKKILLRKRELREAAHASGYGHAAAHATTSTASSRFDEHTMAQINERNRKLDRERIQEAERRAARAKKAAALSSSSSSAPQAPVDTDPAQVSAALASAPSGTAIVPTIDVDLGDF